MSLRLPRVFALAALLVALAPSAGRAYVRTAVSQTPSLQSTCADGLIYTYWVQRNHPWWLFQDPNHPSTLAGMNWNDLLTAMKSSAQTWQDVSCTDLTFQYEGATSQDTIGYDPSSNDNENIEIFREEDCSDTSVVPADDQCHADGDCGDKYNCWGNGDGIIALTTTTFDQATGQLVDSDTEFDATTNPADGLPYYRFTASPEPVCTGSETTGCLPACENPRDPTEPNCVATDVQNTATHEFGHYLGLAHPGTAADVLDDTMYYYAPPGQTSKRTLAQDDINGICSIYPKGQQTDWCIPPAPTTKQGCESVPTTGLLCLAGLGLFALRRRLHRHKL